MNSVSLGKPAIINGQEVILIKDMVGIPNTGRDGEVYSIIEERGADGRPAIYAAEEDILRLREHYPGVKVFGLWQLLFYNQKVKLGEEVIIFPVEEADGFYLIMEAGKDLDNPANIAKSGEYINNYVVDYISYDLTKASRIEAEISELRLPPKEAYTRVELSNILKSENNKRWMAVGALCSLVLIASFAANYGLSTVYKSKMADYNTQQVLVDELNNRNETLRAERLLENPNDRSVLERIFKILEVYPNSETPTGDRHVIGFTGEHIIITSSNAPVDPKTFVDGVETIIQPDLSYQVVIDSQYVEDDTQTTLGGFL